MYLLLQIAAKELYIILQKKQKSE